ncbi:MAG: chlorite dismutase family protein [Verrucomicrobiota bacterium]
MTDAIPAVVPVEGWHVLHLFYKIEYGQWSLSSADEQLRSKTNLAALVQEIRATADTQLLTLAVVSPKADLGFMLLCPDLQAATGFEKRLSQALGADVLTPVYSYLSITEAGEAVESEARKTQEELFPSLPGWPVFCFYPMSRRRNVGQNWYRLPCEERKRLLGGEAGVFRSWQGKVCSLVTGSTGLEDAEWAVTLLGQTTFDVKKLVTELHYDAAGADYTEYGEIYIGLQLPLDELFRKIQL